MRSQPPEICTKWVEIMISPSDSLQAHMMALSSKTYYLLYKTVESSLVKLQQGMRMQRTVIVLSGFESFYHDSTVVGSNWFDSCCVLKYTQTEVISIHLNAPNHCLVLSITFDMDVTLRGVLNWSWNICTIF